MTGGGRSSVRVTMIKEIVTISEQYTEYVHLSFNSVLNSEKKKMVKKKAGTCVTGPFFRFHKLFPVN